MASELREMYERVLAGRDLDESQAAAALGALTDARESAIVKAGFLTALRMKGETPAEVRGLALAMRDRARGPITTNGTPLIDTCGTGGDGSGSFNLSTTAALLLAALGAKVAKHGNRSVSSRCGSADLLDALGVPLGEDVGDVARRLDELGFAFLFAPAFHPATAAVMGVRKELATRTVFNVLGPLANPARPAYQLVGAWDEPTARLMAHALRGMEIERAFVVHGEPGWDEATPAGCFLLLDVCDGEVEEQRIDPREFGLARCAPRDLAGGDAAVNARIARGVFAGEAGAPRDAVVLNAALGLLLLGEETLPADAAARAAEAIDDGRLRGLVERLRRDGRKEERRAI